MFSVALSLGLPPVRVTNHPALRSSDFPLAAGWQPATMHPLHTQNFFLMLSLSSRWNLIQDTSGLFQLLPDRFWRQLLTRNPAPRQRVFLPDSEESRLEKSLKPAGGGSLFYCFRLMIEDSIAGRAKKHLLAFEQIIELLRRNIHKAALANPVDNTDDRPAVSPFAEHVIFF